MGKKILTIGLWGLALVSILFVLGLDRARGEEVRTRLNVIHSPVGGAGSSSGATTFGPSGSGVSVLMIVDLESLDPAGYFSFQVERILFSDDVQGGPPSGVTTWAVSGLTNADPGGTGIGTSTTKSGSGASVVFLYGISNKRLSVKEWEDKGQSGTTDFRTVGVNSGNTNEPMVFTPEVCAELMLGCYSAVSQFRIPEGWLVVQ